MSIDTDTLGKMLALSAASLFISACGKDGSGTSHPDATTADAGAVDAEVHCFGINECRGQSACDVKDAHVCAGQNECAGKGWIVVKKSECAARGGTEV